MRKAELQQDSKDRARGQTFGGGVHTVRTDFRGITTLDDGARCCQDWTGMK